MAQLPSYAQRTRRPFQPDPVRYRRQPLRHPQYCIPLVPLIASTMLPRRRHEGAVFDSGVLGHEGAVFDSRVLDRTCRHDISPG
ncbi:hypothetical protein QA638_09125 [Rhizobium leguminosarum]|nr:hypothetical protein [Rhizobium leguminosarum]MDX6000521.1 hypothetical protein [Rhizobium leguminosarum]WFT88421.1 hypothetical protein QA638_09125 [Rhizobium leguminosarum]WHO79729.1 hypothetical protein QMO81_002423 [Rhizobium leguminosarum]